MKKKKNREEKGESSLPSKAHLLDFCSLWRRAVLFIQPAIHRICQQFGVIAVHRNSINHCFCVTSDGCVCIWIALFY